MSPFTTARNRITRAKFHGIAMAKFWDSFDTSQAYSHRMEIESNGTGKIFLAPVKVDWLSEFSLQLGEIMYQLRAALDSCIYDCAIVQSTKNPPPNERDLQFPICTTPNSFKNCAGQIAPLSDQMKAFIESVQPYQTAPPKQAEIGRILSILNKWAIIDRHRTLPVIGAFPSNVVAQLGLPPGMILEWSSTDDRRILEHESQFASFKLSGYRPDAKIELKLAVGLEIAINKADGTTEFISKAPSAMVAIVEEVVRGFEKVLGI